MENDGERLGKKILVIGEGNQDAKVFETIRMGYDGPIGILNHTREDARKRLEANILGLEKLTKSIK
jgi:hypothetical protein